MSGYASSPPSSLSEFVLDVLQAIGYGGSTDSAERLGRGGDGGVDGVIREDKLGLDLIYVQAKRWANTVGRPDIQQFVGALNGHRASKGVFITTSTFSRDAIEYADAVNPRVILLGGKQLAELMVDHDVASPSRRHTASEVWTWTTSTWKRAAAQRRSAPSREPSRAQALAHASPNGNGALRRRQHHAQHGQRLRVRVRRAAGEPPGERARRLFSPRRLGAGLRCGRAAGSVRGVAATQALAPRDGQ